MPRIVLRSLRLRLALLAGGALLMAVSSAGALILALNATDRLVGRLAAAEHRLELLSGLSGRVGEYALVALQATETSPAGFGHLVLARDRVRDAFDRVETAIGEEVGRLDGETERTLIAARSRGLALMRARFEILDGQAAKVLEKALLNQGSGRDALRVALDAFASGFGPAMGLAIEAERTAAKSAREDMAELRRLHTWAAGGAVILALALALLLYRTLARPLLKRVSEVATGAAAIGQGRFETRLMISGRDELSLAMARINRMAALLARREARLQETVAARTAELSAANRQLGDVDQARRRFFTDISHELRTPLTVILGETDVTLRARDPRPDDMRAALEVIRARARRLHRRVEDLLRVARSESGQIDLDLAPTELAGLLHDTREGVAGLARTGGVSLTIAPVPDGLFVEADRDWLRQVLEGLLSNAIRHSVRGKDVRLSAGLEGNAIVIRVADQGNGIPEDMLPHVFERFWSGSGAGFGIGLALAHWIVERHDGTIALESRTAGNGRAASGTTVTLRLPAPLPLLAGAAE